MSQSLSSRVAFTLLTFTLTFLFYALSSPSVLAQDFIPHTAILKCSVFVEGQGFYLLGDGTQENFMIDLSVSWNTSNPVYKKLKAGPEVYGTCAATINGDLFTVFQGRGYIYNVKSSSWKSFQNINFAALPAYKSAVSDPETGIVYFPDAGADIAGKRVMLSVDPGTETVNSTALNPRGDDVDTSVVGWSAHLRSLVALNGTNMVLFTPSKVSESSDGWSVLNITGRTGRVSLPCSAPAYGGSTMAFVGGYLKDWDWMHSVYTLDVVKRTWKQGPSAPKGFECIGSAVSGDQFIIWGNPKTSNLSDTSSMTLVFNMKTEKWVSKYVAPPRRPTTTSHNMQPSQTPTQNTTASELGEISSGDRKPTIISVAVAGCLLAIIAALFVYRRRTRQPNPNGPSPSSLDVKDDVNASRKSDPSEPGHARLHQGAFGADLLSEHPHAIVEDPTMIRGVQEGAHAIQISPQHPHIMVDKQELAFQTPPQHSHAIGKAELEEQ
ncbi:MAG: hypothetical protein J3Q66DRAFT_388692 [Benniella sp.]|nr:MAG: hypothetical protein J3Q66DRAFT_388692 [Benniella sp.]